MSPVLLFMEHHDQDQDLQAQNQRTKSALDLETNGYCTGGGDGGLVS